MKKVILSLTVLITFQLLFSVTYANVGESEKLTVIPIAVQETVKDEIVHEQVIEEEKRPYIPDIPLDEKVLDYIWRLCIDNDLSYTMILAIAKQESSLGIDKFNKNKNGTHDSGLMQINSSNIKWLSEKAEIDNVDPMNNFDSITMAIEYLKMERNYWRTQELSEEQVYFMTILSYNKGKSGARSHVKRFGWHSSYVDKVSKYKSDFEKSIEERLVKYNYEK